MSHKPFSEMKNEFLKNMEEHATAEGIRLRKPNKRLRLIGIAMGIVMVILLVIWMEYHG